MKMVTLKQSQGVGLIEVLVTLLILTTTLLTLSTLQTKSLMYNQSAYFRSQANILACDIFDRIRVNKANFASYNSALASFSASTVPTPAPEKDIYEWRKAINDRIPSSKSGIECLTTTRLCTITIKWAEITNTGTSDDTTTFTYTAGF